MKWVSKWILRVAARHSRDRLDSASESLYIYNFFARYHVAIEEFLSENTLAGPGGSISCYFAGKGCFSVRTCGGH